MYTNTMYVPGTDIMFLHELHPVVLASGFGVRRRVEKEWVKFDRSEFEALARDLPVFVGQRALAI